MIKNNNLFDHFIWSKNILNSKYGHMIFLLLLIGVVIGGCSISGTVNIFENVICILNNDFVLIFIFISFILNALNIIEEVSNNYNFILRQNGFSCYFESIRKKLFISNLLLLIMIFVLSLSVAITFSFGKLLIGFSNSILLRLFWLFLKIFILFNLLSYLTIVFLNMFEKRKLYILLIGFIIFAFLSFSFKPIIVVNNFWDVPLIFTWCFGNTIYGSFALDLFSLSLHLIVLSLLYVIFYERVKIVRERQL